MAQRFFAIAGSVYGIWMIISAGIVQFLITSILYAPGIWVYMRGKAERGEISFLPFEKKIAYVVAGFGAISIILIFAGIINPF